MLGLGLFSSPITVSEKKRKAWLARGTASIVLFSGKKALVVLPLECVGTGALLPVCFKKEMWEGKL